MINSVCLVGRLTKDPELKYTGNNTAVASFNLAVNRTFKDANGERETDFINCVIWRQKAENLANWAKKDALIGITGRIQTRSYENQQGQRVYVTEVVAENFQMLESRAAREGSNTNQGNTSGAFGNGYAGPYGQQAPQQQAPQQQNQGFAQGGSPFGNANPMDISDDDLPF
ncbi:single-stranded DNA-binding protein [Streptococcus salivarius]|uniref:single-stranded DNA-binding protein n=1 Tax=Streptococcus salivarius TaxID=1304 RepID=UPI002000FF0C|nr:single-stranded DNA-binding protein [Streptococcus salivarius]